MMGKALKWEDIKYIEFYRIKNNTFKINMILNDLNE